MNRKLFVVSDVHGYYTELVDALKSVGFDEKNKDHIFVSCGDLFDRGRDNLRVYNFVNSLKRKILLKGNHEDSLYRVLTCGQITKTDISNGMDITVTQLLGEVSVTSDGEIDISANSAKIREITAFIDSMPDYYETERYVFTHGWLPVEFDGNRPYIDDGWRNASKPEWKEARWLEWQQLYDVRALLSGKTIVCGHRPAFLGHMFDSSREPDCSEPFYGDGMIAIDAWTIRSGRVNVLVIED